MTYSIYTTNTSPTFTVTAGTGGASGLGVFGAGGASGAGTVLTTSSNGLNWNTIAADPNLQGSSLQVKGDANFEGDVKIKGKSIADSLERIEERLAILRPNEELEEKWENLRALGQAYRELEKEILEKQEMWAILKK